MNDQVYSQWVTVCDALMTVPGHADEVLRVAREQETLPSELLNSGLAVLVATLSERGPAGRDDADWPARLRAGAERLNRSELALVREAGKVLEGLVVRQSMVP